MQLDTLVDLLVQFQQDGQVSLKGEDGSLLELEVGVEDGQVVIRPVKEG
jgi:hypothetical protein